MKNVLAPGTAVKLLGLRVDATERPLADVSLVVNAEEEMQAVAISERTPVSLALGKEVVVKVRGDRLSAGTHEILLRLLTSEVGELAVPVRDVVEG